MIDELIACPICGDRSTFKGDPAASFCDEHYRQYLATFQIAPRDLAAYRATRLEALSPQPPAETGDDDAEWLRHLARDIDDGAEVINTDRLRAIASRLSVSTGDDELVAAFGARTARVVSVDNGRWEVAVRFKSGDDAHRFDAALTDLVHARGGSRWVS